MQLCCKCIMMLGVSCRGHHTPLDTSTARGKSKTSPFAQPISMILGVVLLPLPHPH